VRSSQNEKNIEGSGDAGVKVRKKSQICILLQSKENHDQLHTIVMHHNVNKQIDIF
jgi:hypothetical protein